MPYTVNYNLGFDSFSVDTGLGTDYGALLKKSGTDLNYGVGTGVVGQLKSGSDYKIFYTYLAFETNNALQRPVPMSAQLNLYITGDSSTIDFDIEARWHQGYYNGQTYEDFPSVEDVLRMPIVGKRNTNYITGENSALIIPLDLKRRHITDWMTLILISSRTRVLPTVTEEAVNIDLFTEVPTATITYEHFKGTEGYDFNV